MALRMAIQMARKIKIKRGSYRQERKVRGILFCDRLNKVDVKSKDLGGGHLKDSPKDYK